MIDSHCHLADKQFDADRGEVIRRSMEAGVERMITIADTLEETQSCIAIAEQHPEVFCTVGVHPHHADSWKDGERLMALAQSSACVRAIGEIGLDYHYDRSPRDVQRAAFREQLVIAKTLKLPTVVHCREAVEDVWSIVDDLRPDALVLHCCTEKWDDVARFVDRGYFLSFTGIATYPNAGVIRDTIRSCPIEQMMIETDAPYLAPVPHRGKRNEPAFVTEVLACVAWEKGMDRAEVERITTANATAFFGLHDS